MTRRPDGGAPAPKRRGKRVARATDTEQNVRAVLRRLAATCDNPAHVIELYYWSAEPQLISILRRIIALPDEPRQALRAFLTVTADCPESVRVTVGTDGSVALASPAAAEAMQKKATPYLKERMGDAVH